MLLPCYFAFRPGVVGEISFSAAHTSIAASESHRSTSDSNQRYYGETPGGLRGYERGECRQGPVAPAVNNPVNNFQQLPVPPGGCRWNTLTVPTRVETANVCADHQSAGAITNNEVVLRLPRVDA